jgi:hypothetical protein
MTMRVHFLLGVVLSLAGHGVCAQGTLEQDTARIRADQAEILRKAERLREVMTRMLTRYEAEGRVEQAKLLKAGLEHLQACAVLEDVAGIRNDLDAEAFARAIDKQSEVVADLERLLNILLDRRSLDNLDQEIATAERLAQEASRLLAEQQKLREQSQQVAARGATPTEDALAERLAELANRQRAESQQNQRQAGPRLPFLEDALARVRALLEQQSKLETSASEQTRAGAADPRRETSFRLGELAERARALTDDRRRQNEWQRAHDLAGELEKAAAGDDAQARERALQRLHDLLTRLARPRADKIEDLDAAQGTLDELTKASHPDATKDGTRNAAQRAKELAAAQAAKERAAADRSSSELSTEMQKAADDLAGDAKERPASARALDEAKKQLEAAGQDDAAGRAEQAQSALARAARAVSEARQKFEASHPDAGKLADDMAAESAQAARNLRGAPQGAQEENDAAAELERAEKAQRAAADALDQRSDAKPAITDSRAALEKAKQTLEQAIGAESTDGGASNQAAAERQQQLRQQAAATRSAVKQGAEQGGISQEQAGATDERVQRAEQAMERAQNALARGERASAAEQQRQAADELQQAEQALRQARGLNQEQKAELDKLAKEQQKLEQDILALAREVEERKNRAAAQALQQASEASRRAQQAMEQGDPEDTDEQQQQAEAALERAQEALQEERDRYMDLRQEELLFKMREELEQFLAKQVAITQSTLESGKELADTARMTRPLRRRLNELAEREQELVARATFMAQALRKEEEIVYSQVLTTIGDDLADVARRLGGTNPDPGEYTQTVQHDAQDRLTDLIEALKREQQRRQQEQQQQQQQKGRNQQTRKPLVPFRAELQMLKRLEEDVLRRLERLQQMVGSAGADGVSETEVMLIERLGHRHATITKTFLQLKAKLEAAMQEQEQGEESKGK